MPPTLCDFLSCRLPCEGFALLPSSIKTSAFYGRGAPSIGQPPAALMGSPPHKGICNSAAVSRTAKLKKFKEGPVRFFLQRENLEVGQVAPGPFSFL